MRERRSIFGNVLTVTILAFALTGVTGCSDTTDEVRAERIVLVDGEGTERATLSVEDEAPKLRLYDGEGRRRAALALSTEGSPGIALLDENGKVRAAVEMDHGEARIVLYHADGRVHREIK